MYALTDVLVAVVIVVLSMAVLVSWRFVREWVKGSEYARFVEMAEAAVSYAEQTMQGREGQEKLMQVMVQLQSAFPNLDVAFIRVFVESFVRSMKQSEVKSRPAKKLSL